MNQSLVRSYTNSARKARNAEITYRAIAKVWAQTHGNSWNAITTSKRLDKEAAERNMFRLARLILPTIPAEFRRPLHFPELRSLPVTHNVNFAIRREKQRVTAIKVLRGLGLPQELIARIIRASEHMRNHDPGPRLYLNARHNIRPLSPKRNTPRNTPPATRSKTVRHRHP